MAESGKTLVIPTAEETGLSGTAVKEQQAGFISELVSIILFLQQ